MPADPKKKKKTTTTATTTTSATTDAQSNLGNPNFPEKEMIRLRALCSELKDSVNMTNIDVILSVVDFESILRLAPLMAAAEVPRLATLKVLKDAAAQIQAAVEQHKKAADKRKMTARETDRQVKKFRAYMRKFVQPAPPSDSVLTALRSHIRRNTGRQPSTTTP